MGDKKRTITKKTVLKIVGVLVLLLGMVGIGFLAWLLQNQATPPRGGLGGYSEAEEKTLPPAAEEAQNLALTGNAAEAEKILADAIANTSATNTKERQQLYVQQGVTYGNSGNYQKALESYLLAEQAQSDFTTSHLIAETYETLGNKAKALEYYQKTLTQLDTNSPSYNIDKRVYEEKVKELGGQV